MKFEKSFLQFSLIFAGLVVGAEAIVASSQSRLDGFNDENNLQIVRGFARETGIEDPSLVKLPFDELSKFLNNEVMVLVYGGKDGSEAEFKKEGKKRGVSMMSHQGFTGTVFPLFNAISRQKVKPTEDSALANVYRLVEGIPGYNKELTVFGDKLKKLNKKCSVDPNNFYKCILVIPGGNMYRMYSNHSGREQRSIEFAKQGKDESAKIRKTIFELSKKDNVGVVAICAGACLMADGVKHYTKNSKGEGIYYEHEHEDKEHSLFKFQLFVPKANSRKRKQMTLTSGSDAKWDAAPIFEGENRKNNNMLSRYEITETYPADSYPTDENLGDEPLSTVVKKDGVMGVALHHEYYKNKPETHKRFAEEIMSLTE